MKTLMIIGTSQGGMYYALAYLAAFLVAGGIAIYTGFKKGYPKITWLLILLTGGMFFIIGEKVFTYSTGQWEHVFSGFQFPVTDNKTILGGIIGLFVGLLFAKTWLKFNQPVMDNFAIALPLAMAISRIGCLMAGCCFGTPTDLHWGIQYDTTSMVYQVHLSHGLIDLHDKASLAVHPVQLYQVIGCLAIAFLVWRTRNRWKSGGNLFLFSVLCYATLRFLIEFVRDPASSFVLVKLSYGLKSIQLLILAVMIAGTLTLIYRESKTRTFKLTNKPNHSTFFRMIVLIGILCIIVLVGRGWFTILELSTILLFLIPIASAIAIKLYCRYSVAGFRWIVPLVFLGSCIFMAQTNLSDEKKENKITFDELGFTGIFGNYGENLKRVSTDDCGNKYYEGFGSQQNNFYQAGIDYSHNQWKGKDLKKGYGIGFFLGDKSSRIETDSPPKSSFILSPYIYYDKHLFGFKGGLLIGQFTLNISSARAKYHNNGEIVSSDYRALNIFPSISLRVGPKDILFGEFSMPNPGTTVTPYPLFQFGLGSGLGKTNGTKISAGYCFNGLYSELYYPLWKIIVIRAYYASNFASGNELKRVFSVGVNFRIYPKSSSVNPEPINN